MNSKRKDAMEGLTLDVKLRWKAHIKKNRKELEIRFKKLYWLLDKTAKRMKKECSYGESCYRRNPAHFREFSHPHLEAILDEHNGEEEFPIPSKFSLQRQTIIEQLEVIIEKQLYEPKRKGNGESSLNIQATTANDNKQPISNKESKEDRVSGERNIETKQSKVEKERSEQSRKELPVNKRDSSKSPSNAISNVKDSEYQPIVRPTRRPEDFLKVVRPKGKMAEKHAASAPYHIFYTTITDSKETHSQPYSVTFLELLDSSLGELKCSLQINFMVDPGWLLAQYYFAGYSQKKLTILYGEDVPDMRDLNKKKPQVDAHYVTMSTPFGKHHTLWLSPKCNELPADAMPHDGESPTMFKKTLLRYLHHYHMPQLSYYIERVKRCDFSDINVFLIASAPGSHFDFDWGMTRVGSLLRQHCYIPPEENTRWPLLAQASSLGSYGKEPKLWLTGDFLHNFTKIKSQPQLLSSLPELKLIYPSLENVKRSHDGLLGGGCLPYAADAHSKQPWLNNFLYQWRATSTYRDRAMPHIKSYTRISPDNKMAAYYLLTSANVSKAAWGSVNKGNQALRIMSYEAGVLFLPRFVINEDLFPLEGNSRNRLILAYDIPPQKYTSDMSPWVSDYLR